ncbi:uncharacterized protein LOC113339585 [Papaver somniferum]|uniref:uncharacterized protein LOC113339585 n=1 Tax=Papaver somniferum TaxID=3469 RepID=UPI000E6F7BA2|nr:uncharacterized protein LOC113339585 [Papaver somniferum]
MATTSITTIFLFVLMVVFITEMAFGRPEPIPAELAAGSLSTPLENGEVHGEREENLPKGAGLKGNGKNDAGNGLVTEEMSGMLKKDIKNGELSGNLEGSRNVGPGIVEEERSLSGKGTLKDTKGILTGNEKVNAANGLATGHVEVQPKGNLQDGTLEVTATGSVVVAGKQGLNPHNEKTTQTYGSRSNGKAHEATTYEPAPKINNNGY